MARNRVQFQEGYSLTRFMGSLAERGGMTLQASKIVVPDSCSVPCIGGLLL